MFAKIADVAVGQGHQHRTGGFTTPSNIARRTLLLTPNTRYDGEVSNVLRWGRRAGQKGADPSLLLDWLHQRVLGPSTVSGRVM